MLKITKIEKHKRNKERYHIYMNDQYYFTVDEDILVKFRLLKGSEFDEDFIESVIKEEEKSRAKNYALKLLNYKRRTEKEIYEKMKEKGYDEENIEFAIEFLKSYNYIDDLEYAKCYVKDKYNLKKLGKQRIKTELYNKGIRDNIINEVIKDVIDDDNEYDKALELARKKLSTTYKNDDKVALYRKLGGFLQRKGYSFDIVKKVLNELI
ncbi:hypothetical protein CLPU_1c03480 [Gottschalkia purinilytica]|uniref:Regulatory protein RecX n=1 Tax=Gottschalkia purinilytica TaxID=1503 RepID=A0A0L0WFC7_GOTPU|nr:RecX family transcriptional regulator [Gottschalkia purinilytica]KNF10183.1 hypothetical protein CLPU_1c03480 [Gottschalkia purinilytica]